MQPEPQVEEKRTSFESISKFVPLVGPFIIIMGVLNLSFFYDKFNITIISFLEFSEILTSFLDKVFFLTISVLLPVFFFIPLHLYGPSKIGKAMFSGAIIGGIVSSTFPIILPIFRQYSLKYSFQFGFMPNLLILSTVIVLAIIQLKARKFFYSNITILIWLYVTIIFFILISFSAAAKAFDLKVRKKNYGITVTYDTTVLRSDSSVYYIGKTNKYVFIYNEKTKMTSTIPIERVKQIDFPPTKF